MATLGALAGDHVCTQERDGVQMSPWDNGYGVADGAVRAIRLRAVAPWATDDHLRAAVRGAVGAADALARESTSAIPFIPPRRASASLPPVVL